MALEKDVKINSLFVRWNEKGDLQGAFITELIQIFEDGERISARETKPQPVEVADLANQEKVKEIIGQLQVDQFKAVKEKNAEIEDKASQLKERQKQLKEANDSIKAKNDELKEKIDNLKEKNDKLALVEPELAEAKEKINRLKDKVDLRDKTIAELIDENKLLKQRLA